MLLVKIFEVERYWAYAMHLKQKVAQSIMDTKRAQKTMKEKFKQAADTAKELLDLCKLKLGTDDTVFEAEAYYLFLRGQALVENEKPEKTEETFREALRDMHKANELYTLLRQDKDALTQIIYKEKMDQIEPFIRLSFFKLGGENPKNKAYFEAMKEEVAKEVAAQRESVQKEKKTKQAANYMEVKYGGKIIPLNTEQLQILYNAITKQLGDAEQAKTSADKISMLAPSHAANRGILKAAQHDREVAGGG